MTSNRKIEAESGRGGKEGAGGYRLHNGKVREGARQLKKILSQRYVVGAAGIMRKER